MDQENSDDDDYIKETQASNGQTLKGISHG